MDGKPGIVYRIFHLHRSDDDTMAASVAEFFVPKFNRWVLLRMLVVAAGALVVFGWLLIPCVIDGESMMPTFPSSGFTFCWRGRYWFSSPRRGDIVVVKYVDKVFFLKRIVGLPGDVVQFRRGRLYVNDVRQKEPYVRYVSDWNTKPVIVSPGHCFVVGDNRSQYIERHRFGQIRMSRIVGAPLF
ncbi:MAG: signal peptidase I [Lentisphaeria bacterium]|nr:signal peptidase I [Lentisphaeria bacterium]